MVSLAGKSHVSRVGVSLLNYCGLGELVAEDAAGYVRIATEWAGDPARRTRFRESIRQQMQASRLMDAKGFAADVEDAYAKMWAINTTSAAAPTG